jgi:nucleotide-binding universal stress UspA family protein
VKAVSVKLLEGGRILVPVDGSEYSKRALNLAIKLAHEYSASLTVVHVVYSAVELVIDAPNIIDRVTKEFEKEGKTVLEDSIKRVYKSGVKGKSVLLRGRIGPELIRYAERESFDLIVIGSRGLGAVARLLRGSVSDYVSDYAKCPVLVVK